jgi:hypothetical protein
LELPPGRIQADPFRGLVEVIVCGDSGIAIRLLDASPQLAKERAAQGATRQSPKPNFFNQIRHYLYQGDTALHMAAAAYQPLVVEKLITIGADVRDGTGAAQSPFIMPSMVGPDCPHGIQEPSRRSLQSSFRLAPTRMRSIRAASLHCTAPYAIAVPQL